MQCDLNFNTLTLNATLNSFLYRSLCSELRYFIHLISIRLETDNFDRFFIRFIRLHTVARIIKKKIDQLLIAAKIYGLEIGREQELNIYTLLHPSSNLDIRKHF